MEKMAKKLKWKKYPGVKNIQAPLSVAGNYVISHRSGQHVVSYRPPNGHHHVGQFSSAALAKKAAQNHYNKK